MRAISKCLLSHFSRPSSFSTSSRRKEAMCIRQLVADALQRSKDLDLAGKLIRFSLKEEFNSYIKSSCLAEQEEDDGQFADRLKRGIPGREDHYIRFRSTKSGVGPVGNTFLADYLSRMKEGQDQIFCLAGESEQVLQNSPLLEKIKKMGYEVLLVVRDSDEPWISHLREFKGIKVVCAGRELLKLRKSRDEQEGQASAVRKFQRLCKVMKDIIGDEVRKVVVSDRMVDSPCCLVTPDKEWTANMARVMKASQKKMKIEKIMEINPDHSIIQKLGKMVDAGENVEDMVMLLFETAHFTSGFGSSYTFTRRIHKILELVTKKRWNVEDDA